jgi:hypothetical protein
MEKRVRSGYPSDVSDEEWAFVAPYLALCREDSAQRDYPLRDVFNALRYIAKTGNQWRFRLEKTKSKEFLRFPSNGLGPTVAMRSVAEGLSASGPRTVRRKSLTAQRAT